MLVSLFLYLIILFCLLYSYLEYSFNIRKIFLKLNFFLVVGRCHVILPFKRNLIYIKCLFMLGNCRVYLG